LFFREFEAEPSPIIVNPHPCCPFQGQILTITGIPASQNNLHIYDLAGKLVKALPETEMSTSLLPGLPLGKPSQATRIG